MTGFPGDVLAPEQAARVLKAATVQWNGIGAFVRLALISGARRGELLGARWPDLALPDCVGGCGTLDVTCPGGGKTKYSGRRIALDPGTMDLLETWRSEAAGPEGRGYMFANGHDGERTWDGAWVSRRIMQASAQTGVSVSVTGLRRYAMVRMAALGVSLEVTACRLGLAVLPRRLSGAVAWSWRS
jgi:integrase